MAQAFDAQISSWVAKTKARMLAVRNESAERIVAIMQTPGPSVAFPAGGEGGHMPIDSGFLRFSLQAVVGDNLPSTVQKPDGKAKFDYSAGEVNLVIAGAAITDVITVAYTANYAKYANYRYQFVGLAAQQWKRVVAEVAAEARGRAGK